jgi:hypothetical protein
VTETVPGDEDCLPPPEGVVSGLLRGCARFFGDWPRERIVFSTIILAEMVLAGLLPDGRHEGVPRGRAIRSGYVSGEGPPYPRIASHVTVLENLVPAGLLPDGRHGSVPWGRAIGNAYSSGGGLPSSPPIRRGDFASASVCRRMTAARTPAADHFSAARALGSTACSSPSTAATAPASRPRLSCCAGGFVGGATRWWPAAIPAVRG